MGKNLIVLSEIVHNKWLTSSGAESSSSYCMSTGWIPVEPGETISLSYWQPENEYTGNGRLWTGSPMYYKSDRTYLSGYGGQYTANEYVTYTETVPEEAAYVRATFQIPNGMGTAEATEIQQNYTIDSDFKWQIEKGQATGWKPSQADGGGVLRW